MNMMNKGMSNSNKDPKIEAMHRIIKAVQASMMGELDKAHQPDIEIEIEPSDEEMMEQKDGLDDSNEPMDEKMMGEHEMPNEVEIGGNDPKHELDMLQKKPKHNMPFRR